MVKAVAVSSTTANLTGSTVPVLQPVITDDEVLVCQTGAGASMDQFQVYCHLMRTGFIVTR